MPTTPPFLRLHHVSCRLGHVEALADISLDIAPAARCIVAGPSGAGKTTLLRIVAGLQRPSGGQIESDGCDITGLPPERRRFGWVGPEPGLLPQMTAVDQVELPLRLAHASPGDRRIAALQALERVGLAHRAGHLPHQLSSGEAIRVALARASVNQPRCLLLDEPFARMDTAQRASLRGWLSRMQASTGCAILETSHWLQESLQDASHLAILRDGHLVQAGTTRQAWQQPSSPWVADFLSVFPIWWSTPTDAARRGWKGPIPALGSACRLIGVRLDLARWVVDPPSEPCLGPLQASRVLPTGFTPALDALFPDGELRRIPMHGAESPPQVNTKGWLAFGDDAVLMTSTDDRSTG